MNRIKFILIFLGSFVLSVFVLSCVVEDSTKPENCPQIDTTFGEYNIFREKYSENETPMSPCDTGPDSGKVIFDGYKFVIEYQNHDEQEVVITYSASSYR